MKPKDPNAAEPAPKKVWLLLLLQMALMAGWAVVLSRFQEGDVYAAVGPFALALLLVLLWVKREQAKTWLMPSVRLVALGAAVGLVMTLATYPVYAFAESLVPALGDQVRALYRGTAAAPLSVALPWTLVIVPAEEVLWRGSLIDTLKRLGLGKSALVISVVTYAVSQLGAGSLIVGLMALVCGAAWTLLREKSRSLIPPIIAHAIWTPTVLLLHPVGS